MILLFALITCECDAAYDVKYEKADSVKVVGLLADARKQPSGTNYIVYFARQLCGLPYVSHTLETDGNEKLVINLRQLDCTTLVENVVTLNLCMKQKCYTFKAFCDNIRKIRYRGGAEPYYPKRLHYFTEWIEDNTAMGICNEVQSPNPPFTAVQKVNVYYMSTYPDKYKMLKGKTEYIKEIAQTEKLLNKNSYRYIPETAIANSSLLRKTIHDGDIIAITTTLKGLDIQHVGFAVWHKDGLHLLNASSLRHKVVEEPTTLYKYLLKQKSMTGVRIVRLL